MQYCVRYAKSLIINNNIVNNFTQYSMNDTCLNVCFNNSNKLPSTTFNFLCVLVCLVNRRATVCPIRAFSGGDNKIATYEDVKNIDASTLLVDVREPKELIETGVLPKSVNIPLGQVEVAFKDLSKTDFASKYGTDKPKPDFPIVMSCRSGVRSAKAVAILEKIGYSNVRNFQGGWLEWEEKSKK